jgi:hypothetical protein
MSARASCAASEDSNPTARKLVGDEDTATYIRAAARLMRIIRSG